MGDCKIKNPNHSCPLFEKQNHLSNETIFNLSQNRFYNVQGFLLGNYLRNKNSGWDGGRLLRIDVNVLMGF